VAAIMLIRWIDVRGVKGQPHLLHPVLGCHPKIEALRQPVIDDRIGQFLGADVHPQVGTHLSDRAEHLVPEPLHLVAFESRLPMHPKLEGVNLGEDLEEFGHVEKVHISIDRCNISALL